MALVPQVVEKVGIPVIAAGGIAGGEQFLAALSLGASGIQIGTKFLVAEECTIHENYKQAILKAKDRSTVSTGNYTGHPVRVIENKFAKLILEKEKEGVPKEEIEQMGTGKLRLAVVDGDIDNGSVMAGQVAAMVNEKATVKEILESMMKGLEEAKENLDKRMSSWK